MRSKQYFITLFIGLLFGASFLSAQQAEISKKQDVAVFALGYYGYNIPLEVLANVDAEIQGVFINLGRFNVLGQTERFSSKDVQDFINLIQTAKQNNTPLPDEVKFGDVQLTEGLLKKLYGAFVVVIPTIVDFQVEKPKNEYEARIKTSVAFLNVAEGTTIGMANIETTGSSKESQTKAIALAINSIPFQLTYEVRKIPAFTLRTQVLQANIFEAKMQFGTDMGVKVGDEYVVVKRDSIGGLVDEREEGLLVIKDVGPQISTAAVRYAGSSLKAGAQLREVPRLGVDVEPYLYYITYFESVQGWDLDNRDEIKSTEGTLAAGAKFALSRGWYNVRPIGGVQINFDTALWLPVIGYLGAEYNLFVRRFALTGTAAVAGASNAIIRLIEKNYSESDDPWLTHFGVKLNIGISYLINRDMRIFTNYGMDYLWGMGDNLGGPFQSYGGYGIAAGVAFKM
ncbi:hypothetical protein [Gracilinema caldarium]|uniref:Outer membrane protein beta-barrel domain-containing protein n=1 Tax=Gracilinema caldarium (strain ATCC 51460 / DSM 7334 / H1) TaxID=744872 RepID=F8F0T6_GRAC1|nr:hypothetical protein [Gracilinema caldarium]AEJ20222.1 hypothetical protein Spica_2097 [Gracilinema caldarium DSM 7334]